MELPAEVLIHNPALGMKGSPGTLLPVSPDGYYEANVRFGDRVHLVHAVYDELPEVLERLDVPEIHSGLFDLGVSSLQLDEVDRGFAYARDAVLDMRMDQTRGITAEQVVNEYEPDELVRLLRVYGEEKFAPRIVSAIVRRAMGSSRSEEIAKNRISPMMDDGGARTGRSTSGGNWPATVLIFSLTIWRAPRMSVPHSNSTQTTEMPTAVAERTRRTPDAPFTAVSTGNVICVSTSVGDMPCASVMTVTVGAVRSGNTSTGIRVAV